MSEFDYLALASDWEKVCNAAGIDTDATADEVIAAFKIDQDKLGEILLEIYDHGSAPNARAEARAIIERLEAIS